MPNEETTIGNSHGGFVHELDALKLYEQISEKQDKIKNYTAHYDELWLLLISECEYSSDFDLTHNKNFDGSQFKWDKILLYKMASNGIIRLQ